MNVFKVSKSTHPSFSLMKRGDSVSMNIKTVVKDISGDSITFEASDFELSKSKDRKHPSEVMKDFHTEFTG